MKPELPNLETVLLLLMSGALFVASPSGVHLRLLNSVCPSQPWEKHTNGIFQVMVLYGAALLALAILSYGCSLQGITLRALVIRHSKEALSALREDVIPSIQRCFLSRSETIWLLLVLVIGAGLRGYFLAQPMRYDEAYTFMNFANRGFLDLFYYPNPNNHVLNTILVKASTLIWGAHPASIRLPAFLAGIALIPLTFCLCRKLRQSGVFAAIAVSVFPYLVSYSTNARGYTLLILMTLALGFVGAETTKKPSVGGAALLSAVAALGMMITPSMLFPVAGIYCWLACLLSIKGYTLRTILLEAAIPCAMMTVVFTMVLYTPVILVSDGVESIVANRFVQSQPWPEFLGQLGPHLRSIGDFVRDVPGVVLLMSMALVIVGIYGSARRRDWPTLLLLPSILFGSVLVFLVLHRIPFARTWIYVIPFILLTADSGFTWILERTSHRIRSSVVVVVVIIGAVLAVSLIATNAIAGYPDTGTFPEAPIVAGYLKPIMTSNDMVEVRVPADWPTYFYLWYYGVTEPYAEKNAVSGATFFVVKKSRYSLQDMTERPVVKLLDFGDMALYEAVDPEDQ